MANGSTTNYALIKPEVGADSDAWGGHLNSGLDLIDAALSGLAVGLINGLTLSAAGSTATFGIAAGNAGEPGGGLLSLGSAYTKTASTWAVGSGNGSLDTGSVANTTWYHVWLIKRVDTGVVDILTSLSATAPTMPANYTLKRRIGAMRTDGSAQWLKFSQNGDKFLWAIPVFDANTTPANSNAALVTLSAPPGVQAEAMFSCNQTYSSSTDFLLITCPSQTDTAPATALLYDLIASSASVRQFSQFARITNTSGQVRVRVQASGGGSPSGTYQIITYGWNDPRGKF